MLANSVAVTRAQHQNAHLVREVNAIGARAIEVPLIAIAPPKDRCVGLNQAVENLLQRHFDWVLITSPNAARIFARTLREVAANQAGHKFDESAELPLAKTRVAAVGKATEAVLQSFGVNVSMVPRRQDATGLVDAMLMRYRQAGRSRPVRQAQPSQAQPNQAQPSQAFLAQRPRNQGPLSQGPLNQGPLNQDPLSQGPLNQGPLNQRPLNRGEAGQPDSSGGRISQTAQQSAAHSSQPVFSAAQKVLLPCADIAPAKLQNALSEIGYAVERVHAYRTLPIRVSQKDLQRLAQCEVISLCSSSAAQSYIDAIQRAKLPGVSKLVTIGPSTSKTLKEAGFEVTSEAEHFSLQGLIEAVKSALAQT